MKPEDKRYILENIGKKPIRELSRELNIKERKIRKFIEKEQKKPAAETPSGKKAGIGPGRARRILISAVLIIILGLGAYINSLNGEFIWDDSYLVVDNRYIRDWSHIKELLTENLGAGGGVTAVSYRPLQGLTYLADFSLWKLDVRGYHITNIILHILAALAIFWLIIVLFDDWLLSLFAGVLFVVHPVHAEAVAYISGRADPLAAVFIVLSLIFYIKYIRANNIGIYIMVLLSYICALLSRENSLILPVLLALYHYSFRKKLNLKPFLPVLAVTALYILARLALIKSQLPHLNIHTTLFQRAPGFFVAVTDYMRLLFLPLNLHMEYGTLLFRMASPKAILGIAILASALVYAFKRRDADTLASFSILWFFTALFPVSNLYPANAYMAEHWLYLPSVGFFLILAKGLSYLYRNKGPKVFAAALIAGLLSFNFYLTVKQNNYWRALIPFYERTLKYAPNSPRLCNDLGVAYYDAGRQEEALALFEKAVKLDPDYPEAHSNLGSLYYRFAGKNEEAIALLNRAIELDPDYATPYNSLASLYVSIGRTEEAIALYKKAVELAPDYVEAYDNLGSAYCSADRYDEAIEMFSKAVKINPVYAPSYNNLANTYRRLGRYEEAVSLYKKALKITQDNPDIYFNLALVYQDLDRKNEAIEAYEKAITLNPNYAPAHYNLAVLYYNEGRYEPSAEHCYKAVELGFRADPDFLKAVEPYRR